MHDLSHDPKLPDPRLEGAAADEHVAPETETEICALCDIVNDTFVAPRAFVLGWRLAGDSE